MIKNFSNELHKIKNFCFFLPDFFSSLYLAFAYLEKSFQTVSCSDL